MNVVTVAEIKRGGFSVLEEALTRGPVHLMKRNRPSAVLLKTEEYETLLKLAGQSKVASRQALNLFLAAPKPSGGGLDQRAMKNRLEEIASSWDTAVKR